MRQRLQDRILNKRKEIEERIKSIEARKKDRNDRIAKELPQRSKSGDIINQNLPQLNMNPEKPKSQVGD